MSGIEVVGVVIGALPIIISALDAYKTSKQRYKLFRFKEPYVTRLTQSLEEQMHHMKTDLLCALSESHLEEKKIKILVDEASPSLFQDPDIADAVREYLGDGYKLFTVAVTRCQEILEDIVQHISGLMSDAQWGRSRLPGLIKAHPRKHGKYEFMNKIKFSLEKDDLDRQVQGLQRATQMLRQLREDGVLRRQVTIESTSRTITKFSASLNNIRKHALQIYSAISQGYTRCYHPEHETRLFLQSRSGLMEKKRSLKQPPISFIIGFSPKTPFLNTPRLFHKTEVKVWEEDDNCFETNSLDDSKELSPGVVTINLPSPPSTPVSLPSKIDDICGFIQLGHKTGTSFDMYLFRDGRLCGHDPTFHPDGFIRTIPTSSHQMLTLRDILVSMANSTSTLPSWTLNQRMALSFNIASSVMQLHSTPWLPFPLTNNSICFLCDTTTNTPTTTKSHTEPQPFIRQTFPYNLPAPDGYDNFTKWYMLELGIVLLELWLGKTIDCYAVETNSHIDNSFGTRYEVARKWLRISRYYVLPFYLDAVERCVEFTFATASARPDWNDGVFRKSVCEHVLQPLRENCPREME